MPLLTFPATLPLPSLRARGPAPNLAVDPWPWAGVQNGFRWPLTLPLGGNAGWLTERTCFLRGAVLLPLLIITAMVDSLLRMATSACRSGD